MLQRLFCALYRGHFWLNTRERDGLWLERTCIHCGKVRRNGQVPPHAFPSRPPSDRPWLRGEVFTPADAEQWEEYKRWADVVPCKHCKRTPEQQRAAGVKYRTTEDECSDCFKHRCYAKAGA